MGGMWAMIIVDRHTDPDVILFRSKDEAVEQARSLAASCGREWKAEYPDSWAEFNTPADDARRCWTYSPEGDHILVKEVDDPI